MLERRAGDGVLLVLEDLPFLDRVDFERVRSMELRAAAHVAHVLREAARAVERDGAGVAGHAAGREQSHQPVDVVAVHVRDEDARDLADVEVAAQELVLRALAAVEEPHLGALRRPQRHARDVARPGRHPGACSEKCYPQSLLGPPV